MSIFIWFIVIVCFILVFLFAVHLAQEGALGAALFFILLLVGFGFGFYFKLAGPTSYDFSSQVQSQTQNTASFPWGLILAALPVAAIIIVWLVSTIGDAFLYEDDGFYPTSEQPVRRSRPQPNVIIEPPQRSRPAVVAKPVTRRPPKASTIAPPPKIRMAQNGQVRVVDNPDYVTWLEVAHEAKGLFGWERAAKIYGPKARKA